MKSKKLIQFEIDFNNIDKMKLFEVEVIDKRNNESDWILFDIEIRGTFFVATHIALTTKQEKSKFIATTKVKIDTDFSIDSNLEELHEECLNSIIYSDFYEILL